MSSSWSWRIAANIAGVEPISGQVQDDVTVFFVFCFLNAKNGSIESSDAQRPQTRVFSLNVDWPFLHTWFQPVDPLPIPALALCALSGGSGALSFTPTLLPRCAEAQIWDAFGSPRQQLAAPHPSRHNLAVHYLHEAEQPGGQGVRRLIKASLGPPSARVVFLDCSDRALWGWHWTDALGMHQGHPRCRCLRYFHDSDHINCRNRHSSNWQRAHEHAVAAVEDS